MKGKGLHIIIRNALILFLIAASIIFNFYCSSPADKTYTKPEKAFFPFFNHSDTARYIGMQQCAQCHQDKFNTFTHTGMGQSFDYASRTKSSARFGPHALIYDKHSDFYYHPYWDKDSSLTILEFRLQGKDTVYKRVEKVDYIIGSGQHTNSHIQNVNGYLNQMPMTFYTQKKEWDLPPGFENGFNTRFSRKIGLECMSCHNSMPGFVLGSENKYTEVPQGIGCENCHGPGSIHVQQMSAGNFVDTSKHVDYSIVNPGKLPIDLQFDVCQRCHLQGNAVLKEGKSFYDFRPGMKLSEYMSVFLPKYEDAEQEFIMASHADRLKMSACFMKSFKPDKDPHSLRPYKQSMTCVTCHNPHVSVKVTGSEVFNKACVKCHSASTEGIECSRENRKSEVGFRNKKIHTSPIRNSQSEIDNCVSCHMPKSGSIDIPHVRVTDHLISRPVKKSEVESVKKFIGLYSVNEANPSPETKAKAYLNQYEKFEAKLLYLDSASKYLDDASKSAIHKNFSSLIHLRFLQKKYDKIIAYVNTLGQSIVLEKILNKQSYSNEGAWTAYRVAEAFHEDGNIKNAYLFYKKANELAPYYLEFKSKYAVSLMELGKSNEAKVVFEKILEEDKRHVSAFTNLGYIYLINGDDIKAEELYTKGLFYDPDYKPLLMNRAGLYIYRKNYKEAEVILNQVLKKHPNDNNAREVLKSIKKIM